MSKVLCPYCGHEADAEFVDIGVGMQQCTPYGCPNCHAVEIGPHDEPKELTENEKRTGWYEPEEGWTKPPSPV